MRSRAVGFFKGKKQRHDALQVRRAAFRWGTMPLGRSGASGSLVLASRRSADSSAANHRRAAGEPSGGDACKLLTAPFLKAAAQKLRFDTERFAHGLKGEGTLAPFTTQPGLGLLEEALARAALGIGVVLEASEGILEDRHHQLLYRPN